MELPENDDQAFLCLHYGHDNSHVTVSVSINVWPISQVPTPQNCAVETKKKQSNSTGSLSMRCPFDFEKKRKNPPFRTSKLHTNFQLKRGQTNHLLCPATGHVSSLQGRLRINPERKSGQPAPCCEAVGSFQEKPTGSIGKTIVIWSNV